MCNPIKCEIIENIGNSLDFAICFLKGAKVSAETAKQEVLRFAPGPLRSRPNSQQQSNQAEAEATEQLMNLATIFKCQKSWQFQFSSIQHSCCVKFRSEGQYSHTLLKIHFFFVQKVDLAKPTLCL